MNTKTMRLPPRRVLTASKRKEREGFDSLKPSPPSSPSSTAKLPKPTTLPQLGSSKESEPLSSNQLLAGYLAHEYLTEGTLLGQQWDPARAEAIPAVLESNKKIKPSLKGKEAEPRKDDNQRYVEVSNLLKADGAHFPGVVNPSQLARFLQMRNI